MLAIKPFRQSAGFCGPACLKMVLAYYGLENSERQLIRLTHSTKEAGCEASTLLKVAKEMGCKGLIKDNCQFSDLRQYLAKKIPVIVDWFSEDDGHYSVVVGLTQRNIYLQDPELGGIRVIDIKTFKRVWFDFPGSYLQSKKDLILRRILVIYK